MNNGTWHTSVPEVFSISWVRNVSGCVLKSFCVRMRGSVGGFVCSIVGCVCLEKPSPIIEQKAVNVKQNRSQLKLLSCRILNMANEWRNSSSPSHKELRDNNIFSCHTINKWWWMNKLIIFVGVFPCFCWFFFSQFSFVFWMQWTIEPLRYDPRVWWPIASVHFPFNLTVFDRNKKKLDHLFEVSLSLISTMTRNILFSYSITNAWLWRFN